MAISGERAAESSVRPERFVYIDGDLIPESRAAIGIRDRGFIYGDGVFDTERTFAGRIFRLRAHIERLYASLAYARIECPLNVSEMVAATETLLAANAPALRPGEDWWVTQRVTSGQSVLDGEPGSGKAATIVIECTPLPLRARARLFRDGIDLRLSARPRIAPEALDPRAKTSNYLNMMLAQREIAADHPDAWAILPDREGHLAEGAGCNVFVVEKGVVLTPRETFVLAGISRAVVIELCQSLGLPILETDLSPERARFADEAFLTSTSLCLCPVRSFDGHRYAAGLPGPVTARLMRAFADHVGFDYVGQYLRFLDAGASGTGL